MVVLVLLWRNRYSSKENFCLFSIFSALKFQNVSVCASLCAQIFTNSIPISRPLPAVLWNILSAFWEKNHSVWSCRLTNSFLLVRLFFSSYFELFCLVVYLFSLNKCFIYIICITLSLWTHTDNGIYPTFFFFYLIFCSVNCGSLCFQFVVQCSMLLLWYSILANIDSVLRSHLYICCLLYVCPAGPEGSLSPGFSQLSRVCAISTPEFSNLLRTPGGRTYSGLCLGWEAGVGKKAARGACHPWLILPRNLRPPSPLVVRGAGRGPEAPRSLCWGLDNTHSQQLRTFCSVASFFGPVSTCFHFSGVS